MHILNRITDIIFPTICRHCDGPITPDTPTAYFCNNCWDGIRWFEGPHCCRCGVPYSVIDSTTESPGYPDIQNNRPVSFFAADKSGVASSTHLCGTCSKDPPAFDKAIAGGPYEGTLAEAIRLFKYKKKIHIGQALANQIMMAPLLVETLLTEIELMTNDIWDYPKCIVRRSILTNFNKPCFQVQSGNVRNLHSCYVIPVPLHIKRLREREFNQSAIIAMVLGKRLGAPLLTDILIRQRYTIPQVELGEKEREENVAGAFAVQKRNMIKDKGIILVDDVYTTGSTVNECAKVLKKNGARIVFVITIARMT